MPLKKQSMAGTSTLKIRGEKSERAVEPMMDMVEGLSGRLMEVTMMWGMRWVLWSLVIASLRLEREVILISESNLKVLA